MKISGLQKITLMDYPGKMASVIFVQGCNFRCPFCQNSSLLDFSEPLLSEREVLEYLEKRKNVLDGVVISGGEPTMQKDLENFIVKIKGFGYSVKLDTNGSNPELLEKLLSNKLIDYVAMDIKNDLGEYEEISGVKGIDVDKIKRSITLIKSSDVDHEFRTTITKEYHTIESIENICKLIKGSKYFIQNFENGETVLNQKLHGFSLDELKEIGVKLNEKYSDVTIRNI